jgi:hypothetical protein
MATPVLNLDTIADRPLIAIDGIAYPLRATDEFSIVEYRTHVVQAQRFSVLLNQAELSPAEEVELSFLLDTYARRVLSAPGEVHAKLSDTQRLAIVGTFAQLLGTRGLTAGVTVMRPPTPPPAMAPAAVMMNGGASSHDSHGSTVGTH